jgi:arylsulfatase A-like enzyme
LALAGYDVGCVAKESFFGPYAQNLLDVFPRGHNVPAGLLNFFTERFPSLRLESNLGPAAKLLSLSLSVDKTKAPVAEAERLLCIPTNRPRFVWLHLLTTHSPYATPKPYLGAFETSPLARDQLTSLPPYGFSAGTDPCFPTIYEGRYDEAVRCLDDGLGELFAWLKAQGRYDRTLIVLTADHGESFTHGYGEHGGPLLSEDLIWIPGLIKPPFHRGAVRDSRLFEQADLTPTLLQMVGIPVPTGIEGKAMSGKPAGLPIFSMNHDLSQGSRTFSVAIRSGEWKFVEHFGHWTLPWLQRELYDLETDPGETQNLVNAKPDRVADLRKQLLAEMAKRNCNPEVGCTACHSNKSRLPLAKILSQKNEKEENDVR